VTTQTANVRPRSPRPSLTPEQKRAARENAEACKDAATNFKVVVAVLAVPAAALGPLLGYGLLAGVMIALFDRETRKAERAVNDPPRPDWNKSTQAQPPRVNPAVLSGTRLESIAIPAAESLKESTALLSATIRGLERAQGAIDSGERAVAELRLDEARAFAAHLHSVGYRTDTSLSALASELEVAPPEVEVVGETGLPPPFAASVLVAVPPGPVELPSELEEKLRAAGIRPSDLALSSDDLPRRHGGPAQSLRRAGKTFGRLGEAFGEGPFMG
jgi:hypothetical protein